jgi:hypothetical protein
MVIGQDQNTGWMAMMSPDQRALWQEAWQLLKQQQELEEQGNANKYIDYGFIVFPAAKVYEGFLKSYFYQMGMISQGAYLSEYFRIGKSLNPDLPHRFRDDTWLYDDVTTVCGEQTAKQLWQAWKIGRNRVFHYNGNGGNQYLSLLEAEERLRIFQAAMEAAAQCEVKVKRE